MVHLLPLLQRLAAFRGHRPFWYRWGMLPGICFALVMLGLLLGHAGIGIVAGVVLAGLFDVVIVAYHLYCGDGETGHCSLAQYSIMRQVHMWKILQRKVLLLLAAITLTLIVVALLHLAFK